MLIPLQVLASILFLSTGVFGAAAESLEYLQKRAQLQGISISFNRDNVNWNDLATQGLSFAYIAATGGYGYQNPDFSSQFAGAAGAGFFRGAYHISILSESSGSGSEQADYFVSNGGNWINDGITLPGAIKVGYDTDDDDCYGLNATFIVSWMQDFSKTYYSRVGRYPVIHTTTHWWNNCTANDTGFGSTSTLWIIHSNDSIGPLPVGWDDYTFWQYQNPIPTADGKERFNGDKARLESLAANLM